MPNTVSCRGEGKLSREFGGRFAGKKKMGRIQCIRELPGRAEFRLPSRPHLPRVSRPPSLNHWREDGRKTLHARLQKNFGPGPEEEQPKAVKSFQPEVKPMVNGVDVQDG